MFTYYTLHKLDPTDLLKMNLEDAFVVSRHANLMELRLGLLPQQLQQWPGVPRGPQLLLTGLDLKLLFRLHSTPQQRPGD